MERSDSPQQLTLRMAQSVEELATRLKVNLEKYIFPFSFFYIC